MINGMTTIVTLKYVKSYAVASGDACRKEP